MPRPTLRPAGRRTVLAPLVAAAVLATGTGAWLFLGGDERRLAPAVTEASPTLSAARSLDLPWPVEGQASVTVDGVGSLGTRGVQDPVPIASLTKVMTAYVILKEHPVRAGSGGADVLADQRAADESYSSVESTVPVDEGRTYSQRRLLEYMMVGSANNVARLLARWDAGDEQAFVAKMNRAADDLGMGRTTYTGVSGMEASTKSTATDQLRLARAVMKDPVFREVVATEEVEGGSGARVVNTNKLLGRDGVVGLKTGSSTPAGGNLVWAVRQQVAGSSRLVLGVVLGQRAGSNPVAGGAAAHEASHALITAVRKALPDVIGRG
ncbi:D-alanyl-D-alanine carboxypeptidase family protein [Streptomyces sp. NPDC127068]|uniref:D-alanyl-D-alanine carboxypeptidase family protein n=1 Tax=Streptomyces sp. NPDC127068 TaxID=3347127 RepID=UPI0036523C24